MIETIPETILDTIKAGIPFGRFADPQEIAVTHAFLTSKETSFITGKPGSLMEVRPLAASRS